MRVSVVIPCHNSLRFLPETLDSVLAQDLPGDVDHFEVVLVDDGGTDDLAGWVERRGDDRLRVVRQENAGVSAARNRGIAESTGDLVAFCDSDDLWVPTTAAALVGELRRDPEVGLAHGWYDVIDADGRATGRVCRSELAGDVWGELVTDNPIAASGVMVRREVFDDVGMFAVNRERFPIDVEDWEMWIRIAVRWKVAVAPQVVARHRRHDANSSADVESIESAYRNLLDVVFADASPEQQALRPRATAHVELRMAWQRLNDRREPDVALQHLKKAAALWPPIRRTGEYRRLRTAVAAVLIVGPRGHLVLQDVNRWVRLASERLARRRAAAERR